MAESAAGLSTRALADELLRRAGVRFDLADRVTIELRTERGVGKEMFCHERIPWSELERLDPPDMEPSEQDLDGESRRAAAAH